jgi:hypothetical protein
MAAADVQTPFIVSIFLLALSMLGSFPFQIYSKDMADMFLFVA